MFHNIGSWLYWDRLTAGIHEECHQKIQYPSTSKPYGFYWRWDPSHHRLNFKFIVFNVVPFIHESHQLQIKQIAIVLAAGFHFRVHWS